ncbi:hypothetical protein O3M35_006060 [Rhynocoris fuscipes]|uniref:G-protein coupled receptors family 1 profile domain-containing protein n=1 Tax=Rhynocoris fuscipes TaxID=488301 RepID=A0AAW1DEK0_9HEMI
MIPLYMLIFLLAVIGNSLVLVTLARNRRMRTVTNVYLFNLVSLSFLYFQFLGFCLFKKPETIEDFTYKEDICWLHQIFRVVFFGVKTFFFCIYLCSQSV